MNMIAHRQFPPGAQEACDRTRSLTPVFSIRPRCATSMDDTMRTEIAARLVEEYGSPAAAADAVWAQARENTWYREGE